MRGISSAEAKTVAENMLRHVICKYGHGKVRNVQKIRQAFQKAGLEWEAQQKERG